MSASDANRVPQSAASVRERLLCMRDEKNAAFVAKLIPNVDPALILGVRTPLLRKLAGELRGTEEAACFLKALPHLYLEENTLHAVLLSREKDYDVCLLQLASFLPCVDNWAVCDCISPSCLKKHRAELSTQIPVWLDSDHPWTIRFGIKMLMDHFLGEDFSPACLELAAGIRSEEYYVNMMIAWYFATALAKQWESALPCLTEHRLDRWVHNKTIQKATESFRIPDEHKRLLRSLRWREPRT